MKKTRILIAESYNAFFKRGGGETEAESLCEYLKSVGFYCEIYGPGTSPLETFNYVIYFSCHPSGIELAKACQSFGIKFLLWPNFWPNPDFDICSNIYVYEFINIAIKIVFKSKVEAKKFLGFFNIEVDKILYVNWFVDPVFLTESNASFFKKTYGLSNFVLSIGLIEPIKNQLMLIRAASVNNIPLVFIGGYRDAAYFELCRFEAASNTVFIPNLTSATSILVSAYAACSVYAEISFDPAGRSAIEAAMQAKPLLLANNTWTEEVFCGHAITVEPDDHQATSEMIEEMMHPVRKGKGVTVDFVQKFLPQTALLPLINFFGINK